MSFVLGIGAVKAWLLRAVLLSLVVGVVALRESPIASKNV